jgi:hypothetical protein
MRRQWTVVAALAACASAPAFAENNEGLYLGYGLGDFSTDLDNFGDIDLDSDDASRIFGGWRFNRWVAVNVDLTDFGRSEGAANALNVSADTEGITPAVIGTLPLGPIELYGKAGVVFYDVEIDAGGPIIDASGEDAVIGFGIGATLFERFNIRGEYERIDIEELDDAEAVWLSAAWRF